MKEKEKTPATVPVLRVQISKNKELFIETWAILGYFKGLLIPLLVEICFIGTGIGYGGGEALQLLDSVLFLRFDDPIEQEGR